MKEKSLKNFWEGFTLKLNACHNELFAFFVFAFYLCLGMSLSRLNTPGSNCYFGADNARAYGDLTNIYANHYRIKVHPLFLILLQPFVLLTKRIVGDSATALVIVEAFVGTVLVISVKKILEKYCGDMRVVCLLTLIFMASFSNMVFATIPETFIFAGAFLAIFWSYVVEHIDAPDFSPKHMLLLCFMGISCFGITLTNYVQYLIGLLALVIAGFPSIRQRIWYFIKINVINGIAILLLAFVQTKCWAGSPFFLWTYLGMAGEFEEFRYMNFTMSLEKIKTVLDQIFAKPLISGSIYQLNTSETYKPILFSDTNWLIRLLIICFYLLFIVLLIKSIKEYQKTSAWLGMALVWNIVLHFIYGSGEAFMYSPHFLFLVIALFGCCLDSCKEKTKKAICIFLAFFLACEFCINIVTYRELIRIVVNFLNTPIYSVKTVFLGTLFFVGVLCAGYFVLKFSIRKAFIIQAKSRTDVALLMVCGYLGFILAVGCCIFAKRLIL